MRQLNANGAARTLDLRYGELTPAAREPDSWEVNPPKSLTKLDTESCKDLRYTMHQVVLGWQLGRVLTFDVLVIWIADHAGDIWYALEELVLDGAPTGHAKHQTCPVTKFMPKLGHPSLIGCGMGRIAGEIKFVHQRGHWEINPFSGRYSTHRKERGIYLNNVWRIFTHLGFTLVLNPGR